MTDMQIIKDILNRAKLDYSEDATSAVIGHERNKMGYFEDVTTLGTVLSFNSGNAWIIFRDDTEALVCIDGNEY